MVTRLPSAQSVPMPPSPIVRRSRSNEISGPMPSVVQNALCFPIGSTHCASKLTGRPKRSSCLNVFNCSRLKRYAFDFEPPPPLKGALEEVADAEPQ